MLSSVKVGAGAIAQSCDAFFIMLLDQPLVRASTLIAMAQTWRRRGSAIVVPAHGGRRGHPILVASRCADEIQSLPHDATLRDFVTQHRDDTQVVEVNDPGVLTDLDTPEDFHLLSRLWRKMTCPTECSARA
jgi:CTP:molybdopterin cytidylyltransferase MocA